jgi:hypothetical protein
MATVTSLGMSLFTRYDGKGIDQASKDLDSFEARTRAMGEGMMSVGRTLTGTVTAPLLAVGATAMTMSADFEESMNRVRAVSGATGQDFEDLRDLAMELGSRTKYSASDAADGMNFLAMAGAAPRIGITPPAQLNHELMAWLIIDCAKLLQASAAAGVELIGWQAGPANQIGEQAKCSRQVVTQCGAVERRLSHADRFAALDPKVFQIGYPRAAVARSCAAKAPTESERKGQTVKQPAPYQDESRLSQEVNAS